MDRGSDHGFSDRDGDRGRDRGDRAYSRGGGGGSYRGGRSSPRHQSYRGPRSPYRSPPPRRNSPSRRSPPPRHGRTPPPRDNDYPAKEGRYNDYHRSRSPRPRRSRSPGPMRDNRALPPPRVRPRSPIPDGRRRSPPRPYVRPRSPLGNPPYERSPLPLSDRNRSPPSAGYRQRSPPPVKRGNRYEEPQDDDYDRREIRPLRADPKRFHNDGRYRSRGRSRSPPASSHPSRGETPGSSRRSSPRGFSDRARAEKSSTSYTPRYEQGVERHFQRLQGRDHSPPRRIPPSPRRSPHRSPRSPPRRGYSPAPKPSLNSPTTWQRGRDGPPARRESEYAPREGDRDHMPRARESPYVGQTSRTWRKFEEPTGSSASRDNLPRSPVDALPIESRDSPRDGMRRSPPSGPSSALRADLSAAPTQPRSERGGGSLPPYARGEPREPRDARNFREQRDYPRDGPSFSGSGGAGRGGRGGFNGSPSARGSIITPYDSRPGPGPPRGPTQPSNDSWGAAPSRSPSARDFNGPPDRASIGSGGPPTPRDRDPRSGPPSASFRSGIASSMSYTQPRFINSANPRKVSGVAPQTNPLSQLEKLVEGGKRIPSALEPAQVKKLQLLEEESRKLANQNEEKQKAKRQSLRDWENAEREAQRDGFKAELAEGHLERLGGEGISGGAY